MIYSIADLRGIAIVGTGVSALLVLSRMKFYADNPKGIDIALFTGYLLSGLTLWAVLLPGFGVPATVVFTYLPVIALICVSAWLYAYRDVKNILFRLMVAAAVATLILMLVQHGSAKPGNYGFELVFADRIAQVMAGLLLPLFALLIYMITSRDAGTSKDAGSPSGDELTKLQNLDRLKRRVTLPWLPMKSGHRLRG